jgi:hypothetical protein
LFNDVSRGVDADLVPVLVDPFPLSGLTEGAAELRVAHVDDPGGMGDPAVRGFRGDHADADDGAIALVKGDAGGVKRGNTGVGGFMA